MQSSQVGHIVKLSGIVIAASQVRSKATRLTVACSNCHHKISNIELKAGFEGYQFPRQCQNNGCLSNANFEKEVFLYSQ